MAPFSLLTDIVSVIKTDGTRIDKLRASVQTKKVFMDNTSVLIEIGDHIECKRSNGSIDLYEVMDPGFHESFSGLPAHYQIDVIKLGRPSKQLSRSVQNNISIGSMTNSQIQQNSSGNIQVNPAIKEAFLSDLKELLEKLRSQGAQITRSTIRNDFDCDLQTIQTQLQSTKPKISIIGESLHSLRQIAEGVGAGVAVELIKIFLVTHHFT